MAIDMVCASGTGRRHSRTSGDNLAVVRFCVGQARLRRPAMQAVLEPGLARLALGGWAVQWLAVRRRLNMAADAIATRAVYWAARLRACGDMERRQEVRWLDRDGPDPGAEDGRSGEERGSGPGL